MARQSIQDKVTRKRVISATKLVCTNPACSHRGEPQPETAFFRTNTPTADRYFLCKDCVANMVNAEDLETVYPVLRDLNLPFIANLWFENAAKNTKSTCFGKYLKLLNLSAKGQTWNDNQKITPEETSNLLAQINAKIAAGEITKQQEEANKELTGAMIEFWGAGWKEEEILDMDRLYKQLEMAAPARTSLHVNALKTYVQSNLRYTKALQNGDVADAAKWYNMMKDAGDKAKVNPNRLTQADLQGGLNSFSELIQAVETAVDVIPLLPKYTKLPRDLPDFVLYAMISNLRGALNMQDIKYEDIYRFWDEKVANYIHETGDPEGLFDFVNDPEMRVKISDFVDLDK